MMQTPNTHYSSEDDDSTDIVHPANLDHQCEFMRRRSSTSNDDKQRRRSSKMSLISIEEDDMELEFNNDDLFDVQDIDLRSTITEVTNATKNKEDMKESTSSEEENMEEKNSNKPSFASHDPTESSSYDSDASCDGDDEEEGCGSYGGSSRSIGSFKNIDKSTIQPFAIESKTRSPIPQVEEEVNHGRNYCLIVFSSIAVGVLSLVAVFVALARDFHLRSSHLE